MKRRLKVGMIVGWSSDNPFDWDIQPYSNHAEPLFQIADTFHDPLSRCCREGSLGAERGCGEPASLIG